MAVNLDKKEQLSALALANIQALASGESGSGNKRPLMYSPGYGTYCCGNTQDSYCGAASCN